MKLIGFALPSVLLTLYSPMVLAASFNSACPDITACLKAVSALTGDQYIYNDSSIKGIQPVKSSKDQELTAANADLLLTSLLHESYISRVPNGEKTYVLMRENDAKGAALPVFYASQTETPKLPDTWDMVTLKYKASVPESVKEMENVIRTYASMGARIYGVEHSGYLIITDNARNIKNLVSTMRENDVKVSPALQKKWDEAAKRRAEERKNAENRPANAKPAGAKSDESGQPAKKKGD